MVSTARLPDTVQGFLNRSQVDPERDTDVLVFHVRDAKPTTAAALTLQYAREFAVYKAELDTSGISRALAQLKRRIGGLGSATDTNALRNNLTTKAEELNTFAALQTSNALVIDRSSAAVQVSPRRARNIAVAIVVGPILGFAVVFLAHALDTRVRSTREVEEVLGLPLLARLPTNAGTLDPQGRVRMLTGSSSVAAEPHRTLRTGVDFMTMDSPARTILITSSVETEGKSVTAANLAISMARGGRNVILIDLDLRRPRLHQYLGVTPKYGVTDVVLGAVSLTNALTRIELPAAARSGSAGSLYLLAAGTPPPDPGEFIGSPRVLTLLHDAASACDQVLLDSPPLLPVVDAVALSSRVDALIMVARIGRIRRPILRETRRILDSLPTRKLGFVLTVSEQDDDIAAGYGYGYGYGYGDFPSGDTRESPHGGPPADLANGDPGSRAPARSVQ